MNKQQYIQYRKQNQVPMELVWDYYHKNTDPNKRLVHSPDQFVQFLSIYNMHFGSNYEKVISHYDKEYNINILKDKDGDVIKVF